ncbi:hypothetical protein QZH41_019014, partial [Actinostola sp. cb2023]
YSSRWWQYPGFTGSFVPAIGGPFSALTPSMWPQDILSRIQQTEDSRETGLKGSMMSLAYNRWRWCVIVIVSPSFPRSEQAQRAGVLGYTP